MNFTIKNCRGHCYDSASSMSGAKYGFATQVKPEEPRVILSNCYVHALQLSIGDMIPEIKNLENASDTSSDTSKLLKYSPDREILFKTLKEELASRTPGFRTLCPTKWTVCAASLERQLYSFTWTVA